MPTPPGLKDRLPAFQTAQMGRRTVESVSRRQLIFQVRSANLRARGSVPVVVLPDLGPVVVAVVLVEHFGDLPCPSRRKHIPRSRASSKPNLPRPKARRIESSASRPGHYRCGWFAATASVASRAASPAAGHVIVAPFVPCHVFVAARYCKRSFRALTALGSNLGLRS